MLVPSIFKGTPCQADVIYLGLGSQDFLGFLDVLSLGKSWGSNYFPGNSRTNSDFPNPTNGKKVRNLLTLNKPHFLILMCYIA